MVFFNHDHYSSVYFLGFYHSHNYHSSVLQHKLYRTALIDDLHKDRNVQRECFWYSKLCIVLCGFSESDYQSGDVFSVCAKVGFLR